jgi:hypothetical protein
MPLICPTCQVFAQGASVPATACYFAWGCFRYFRWGATATWRRPLRAAQFLKPPALPQGNRIWRKIRKIRTKAVEMFYLRFRFVHHPIPSPWAFRGHMRLPWALPGDTYPFASVHRWASCQKKDIRSSIYVWFCLTTPSSSPSSVRHASSISGDHSVPRSSRKLSAITPKNFPNSSRGVP